MTSKYDIPSFRYTATSKQLAAARATERANAALRALRPLRDADSDDPYQYEFALLRLVEAVVDLVPFVTFSKRTLENAAYDEGDRILSRRYDGPYNLRMVPKIAVEAQRLQNLARAETEAKQAKAQMRHEDRQAATASDSGKRDRDSGHALSP